MPTSFHINICISLTTVEILLGDCSIKYFDLSMACYIKRYIHFSDMLQNSVYCTGIIRCFQLRTYYAKNYAGIANQLAGPRYRTAKVFLKYSR